MKVLLLNSVCGYGSTGRIVADLYQMLTEKGHTCKVAYGLGDSVGVKKEDTFFFGGKTDYYCHNFLSRFSDRAGFYSKLHTLKLIKYITDFEPDIIHMHNIHGYYLNIRLLFDALKRIKKPVIWTIHDCWPFTGHCAHYSNNRCYKWKTLCSDCPAKSRYPKSILFSQAKRNYLEKKEIFNGVESLHITTPSYWLKEQVEASFLGGYPVTTVNNGVDLTVFKPTNTDFRKRYGIDDKKMILGVSSAWIPEKGFSDFIKLSSMLDDDYKIVIVGMSSYSPKTPQKMILIPNVKDQRELAGIYTAADLYVSFSLEETFGLPTVEAMACGTPVLTYDETALPEPVTKNSGVVIKARNIEAAFKAIIDFPKIKKDDIINEARKYDKRIKYNEYLDIYSLYVNE